ncbi:mycofactocin precursor MftA [Streptomyces sp. WM6386]|uniref:mycofactocin precursor MftA n=1 Tax=Streptomyces sp. WM6386 TaxID=1415558 RepID=UPI0007C845D9|nr:mycofactocin precursor MftA [Streptomyces sp. WM6386]
MNELRSAPTEEAAAPTEEAAVLAETGQDEAPPSLIEAEDLLEEISIDGMCGVY